MRYRVIYFQCLCYLALPLCIVSMHLLVVFFDRLCVSFSFVFFNFLFLKLQFMRIKMYIKTPHCCLKMNTVLVIEARLTKTNIEFN